jgi:hypothetical protein
MTCICNCDYPITVKSTSVAVSGTNLIITVSGLNLATLTNEQLLNVIVCQSLPVGIATEQVYLSDGTTNLPIRVKTTGNNLRADQVRCRTLYKMIYGSDSAHLTLRCLVPDTIYVAPNTAPANVVNTPTNGTTA